MKPIEGELNEKRKQLLAELEAMGEFRRGSVNVFYRRCGKPNCACAREGHPGHGPARTLTFKDRGESKARVLRSEAETALAREQVARHDQFQDWSRRWLQLNEDLCDQRLAAGASGQQRAEEVPEKKRRLRSSRRLRRRYRV